LFSNDLQVLSHLLDNLNDACITDPSKPDGTPRKLMDVSRLANMGWQAKIDLEEGLEATYRWYLDNHDNFRK
jgi:GDP-L-fucose synthase